MRAMKNITKKTGNGKKAGKYGSKRNEAMEKQTSNALEFLYIFTLFATLLRVAGYGIFTFGVVETGYFSFRDWSISGLWMVMYALLPIAILVCVVFTEFNEPSRLAAAWFSFFAFLNYAALPLSSVLIRFISRRMPYTLFMLITKPTFALVLLGSNRAGFWLGIAVTICLSCVMAALGFSLVKLGGVKRASGQRTGTLALSLAMALCVAAFFAAPLMRRIVTAL